MSDVQNPGISSIDPQRFRVSAEGEGELVGGRCRACGCTTWGVRALCPRCWADGGQEEIILGREGTLYSLTETHRPQNGFRGPYTVGLVDLPEGVRVFGRIHWPDGSRWKPGAPMRLFAERVDFDGGAPSVYVPAFRPVDGASHA